MAYQPVFKRCVCLSPSLNRRAVAQTLKTCVLVGTVAFSSAPSWSDGPTIVTSLAFQNKQLTFDQAYSGTQTNQADFSADLPTLSLAGTLAFKKLFFSLKYEQNLSDTSTGTSETDRSQVGEANLIALPGSGVDVKRQDMSLTVGYNVWSSINLFVGYLRGETVLKPDPFCADVGIRQGACPRINRAAFQFFLADQDAFYPDENIAPYEQAYSESGPFFGGSYSIRFESAGTLSFSLAYAQMDGEYSDNAYDPDGVFNIGGVRTFLPFDYEGDSTGTSLGVSWVGSLSENTAYVFDIRRQSYSMDGSDQTGATNLQGVKLSTDEEILGISAGVQVYF